jgi:hypothetical protein
MLVIVKEGSKLSEKNPLTIVLRHDILVLNYFYLNNYRQQTKWKRKEIGIVQQRTEACFIG